MAQGAKRPKTAKQQIRHSIDKLSLFESMINGCLTNTEEQYRTFSAVKTKPYIVDDETVNRAIKLYQAQLKDVPLYRQQLTWWQEDPLTDAQRQRVEVLLAKLLQINNQSEAILVLLADIQKGTINRILEMEDGELGLAFLMGKLNHPDKDK